jgi:hypothetical protein
MADTHFSKVLKPGESAASLITSDSLVAVKNSSNRTLEIGCPMIRVEPGSIAVVCKDNGHVKSAIAKRLVRVVTSSPVAEEPKASVEQSSKTKKAKQQVQESTEVVVEPEQAFFETVAQDEPESSVQLETLDGEQQPNE